MEVKMWNVSNDNNDVIDTKVQIVYFPTETNFRKLSRPCKSFPCFQKMVQLSNFMRIMLLA